MNISGIDFLGIDRVMRRGSGEILADQENALLVRDLVSGAYMLACGDADVGIPLLDRHLGQDCKLLMVSDDSLGNAA